MRIYETTFIINPQADDATIDRQVTDITDLITKNEGKIVLEDKIGTRRLAYSIKGLTQGYYASIIFEAPEKVLPLLERHYKLNEAYIRNLTVRFDGEPEQVLQQQNLFVKSKNERGFSKTHTSPSKDEIKQKEPPPSAKEDEMPEPVKEDDAAKPETEIDTPKPKAEIDTPKPEAEIDVSKPFEEPEAVETKDDSPFGSDTDEEEQL